MSESETKGRCRREMTEAYKATGCHPHDSELVIADALDRLAAELGDVKEMVREIALQGPSEFGRDACDVAVRAANMERDCAIRERDEARAEVERMKAELAARPAANSQGIIDGSKPAAAGWLTAEGKAQLSAIADALSAVGLPGGAEQARAILARAGSPPVVEVPVMPAVVVDRLIHIRYRAALDAAGIPWKEAPRE